MSADKLYNVGTKRDEGKLRFDLIPVLPLMEVARVYTIGSKKYGERNWEKGIKWTRIFGALLRHAFLWWAGEKFDKDNGQHHLAAVVFNSLALMEYERTKPEYDDRWDISKPLMEKSEIRINELYEEQIKKFETEMKNDIESKIPGSNVNVNISVTRTPDGQYFTGKSNSTPMPEFKTGMHDYSSEDKNV